MKTLLISLLFMVAFFSVHAQDCTTCSERVVSALDKNTTYQKLLSEGSQSGIYKATKMMYQQMLTSCPTCVDKQATQEIISQLDGLINALKPDPNTLTFDTSDEGTKPRLNSTQNSSTRKSATPASNSPVYPVRRSGGTMTSGNAN